MTTLIIFIVISILLYIGFLAISYSASAKYTVLSVINSVSLGDVHRNVKISTAIITSSKTPDIKQAGIVVLGSKTSSGGSSGHISNELVLPLEKAEVQGVIEILKAGSPFSFILGRKKEFKMVMDEHPDKAKVLFETSFLFRQAYLVAISSHDIDQLINGLERLLEQATLALNKDAQH